MLRGGEIIKFVKDILFPIFCLSCEKVEETYLCEKCFEKLDFSGVFECSVCHKKSHFGEVCNKCKIKTSLDFEIAIFEYQEKYLIAKILHEFKYNFVEDLKNILEIFIDNFLQKNLDYFLDIDFIVPIPLHKKRFAERGFNQSEIIAKILAKKINKPVLNFLKRNRYTLQQAKLDREGRLKNLEDSFEIIKNIDFDLENKNILLVDDVFTTGTTMGEAAKILKQNKIKIVKGFTIGRGK
ncbi:MAG: ComF family protein [Patescibacteria group bacterium]